MKILFILKESTLRERMGLMSLSSILKASGHRVKLVLSERMGPAGLSDLVAGYGPALIGYSAMTGEHLRLIELNRSLKNRFKYQAVFGGPHATFFPDLINEPSIDAVCVGEGDAVFPEFCRRLEAGGNYWEVANFIVKRNGQIFRNPLGPLVQDLDTLPFPDRELMYEADPDIAGDGTKYFYSSRGCPYQCSYCFNKSYNEICTGLGKVIRSRSPENLVEEIGSVRKKYPLNLVWIGDDLFLLKPIKWFDRFRRLYREQVGLPFCCNVRPNHVKEGVIVLLKEAGLDSAWMGVECGDERVANEILGRNLTNRQVIDATRILQRHGIKLVTQNLIGMPLKNSYRIDLKTLDLNIRLRPTFGWSSLLYPYPGTRLEKYARERGLIDDSRADLETNKSSSVFKYPPRERRKIENLHKLFGLIVRFPFLRKFCGFLVILPLTALYTRIFYLFYGYMLKIKLCPFVSFRREIVKYFRLWRKLARKR